MTARLWVAVGTTLAILLFAASFLVLRAHHRLSTRADGMLGALSAEMGVPIESDGLRVTWWRPGVVVDGVQIPDLSSLGPGRLASARQIRLEVSILPLIGGDVVVDRIEVEGPVVVGGSSRIEPGATILGPAVIGPGCVVEAGARVERSVLFDHTRVSGHAGVVDMVLAGRWCVGRDGAVVDLAASDLAWAVDDARRRSSEGRPSPLLEA